MSRCPGSSHGEVKGYYSPPPWEAGNDVGWLFKIIVFAVFPLEESPLGKFLGEVNEH